MHYLHMFLSFCADLPKEQKGVNIIGGAFLGGSFYANYLVCCIYFHTTDVFRHKQKTQ